MPQLLIASKNHFKYQLFGPIFRQYGFQVLTLEDIAAGPSPGETGKTPAENALAKARHYHSSAYPWVFSDDSALEIDALNGEPGLEARRWGGRFPDDVDDRTWLAYLLERLQGVPPERRTARSIAALALIAPDGSEHVHHIQRCFQIALEPVRPISPGSPLSAVVLGLGQDVVGRRSWELAEEFARWGILAGLLERFRS